MNRGDHPQAERRLARLRHRVYEILEQAKPSDRWAARVHLFLISAIVVSVASVILESVPTLHDRFGRVFAGIEYAAIVVFTAELVLRVWAAVDYPPYRHLSPLRARLAYLRSGGALIDIVTVLPFFASLFLEADLRAFIVLRLLRFLKLARYSPGMRSLGEAVFEERRALAACLVILMGAVITAASLMHLVESAAQPDKFGTIPDAMWWAMITLTTVGYGDVVPITPLGKVVASMTAVMGLVMLALPVGIIATAFADVIHRREFVVTWGMIARVPLFSDLTAEEVAQIMRLLRSRAAEPGEVIVRRGEMGHSMYFVASGNVEIELPHGRHHALGEGQFFGEIAVLRNARRTATVRATTRTQLLVLDSGDLKSLMAQRPDIAARIHEVAQSRASRTTTVTSPDYSAPPAGDDTP